MGSKDKNKETGTKNKRIEGSMKAMYYFLVGVSVVIPVLFLFKLCHLNIYAVGGELAESTQYYLWNIPKLLVQIFKETADGGFFTMVSLIPLGFIVAGFIECINSIIKGFKFGVSWKHAESVNHACTVMAVASALFLLIYSIVSRFFEIKTGFSNQKIVFDCVIFIILFIAAVGKIVAHFYFNKVKEEHLF